MAEFFSAIFMDDLLIRIQGKGDLHKHLSLGQHNNQGLHNNNQGRRKNRLSSLRSICGDRGDSRGRDLHRVLLL